VLKLEPNSWRAYANLGYAFYRLGQLEQADQHLTISLQIRAADPDQYVRRSMARLKLGRLQESEDDLRRAIAMRPDGPGYHFALGIVLRMRGRWAEALEQFRIELQHYPEQGMARMLADQVEAETRRGQNPAPGQAPPTPPKQR
jgi:Flp pilus assembly protein TadD